MFVLSAGFYINYRVMDKDTMYLPAYLVWAIWVGIGYQVALDWLDPHRRPRLRRRSRFVLRGNLMILCGIRRAGVELADC